MSAPVVRSRAEVYDMWATALESGKYEQGQEVLREGNSFCCLGVLCDLAAKDGGQQWIQKGRFYYDNTQTYLSERIRKFMGIQPREMETLVRMNDQNDAGFKAIAKYIRTSLAPRAIAR